MDKNNLKKSKESREPITEGFFIDYMDDFAAIIAQSFSDSREYTDKRFDKIDDTLSNHSIRLDRIEHEIAEIKDKLNRLDRRTDQDDGALFSDIDKLRAKIARLEKEVKILKLAHSKS